MDRLTAFEFLAATDAPQLVRICRGDVVLLQLSVVGWCGVDLAAIDPLGTGCQFATRAALTIEGQGIARPYWNAERPAWVTAFDVAAEQQRIALVQTAARRHVTVAG